MCIQVRGISRAIRWRSAGPENNISAKRRIYRRMGDKMAEHEGGTSCLRFLVRFLAAAILVVLYLAGAALITSESARAAPRGARRGGPAPRVRSVMPARPSVNRTGITSIKRAATKAGARIEYRLAPGNGPRFTPTLSPGTVRGPSGPSEVTIVSPPVPPPRNDGIPANIGPDDIKMTGPDGDALRVYLSTRDPDFAELGRLLWEDELRYRKMDVRTRLWRKAGEHLDMGPTGGSTDFYRIEFCLDCTGVKG